MIYDTFVSISKLDTSRAEDALLARNIQRLQYLVHSRDYLEGARWVGIGASFVVSHDTSTDETGTRVYLMMRDLGLQSLAWPATLVGGPDAFIDLKVASTEEVVAWGNGYLNMFLLYLPYVYRQRTLQLIHHAASLPGPCPSSLFRTEHYEDDVFMHLWRLETASEEQKEWRPLSAESFQRCTEWYQQATEPVLRQLAFNVIQSMCQSDSDEEGEPIVMENSMLGQVVVQDVAIYVTDDGEALVFDLRVSFCDHGIHEMRLDTTLCWQEVEAATGVSLALYQAARLMYPYRPVVELLRIYAADVPGLQRDTDAFGLDGMLESVDID